MSGGRRADGGHGDSPPGAGPFISEGPTPQCDPAPGGWSLGRRGEGFELRRGKRVGIKAARVRGHRGGGRVRRVLVLARQSGVLGSWQVDYPSGGWPVAVEPRPYPVGFAQRADKRNEFRPVGRVGCGVSGAVPQDAFGQYNRLELRLVGEDQAPVEALPIHHRRAPAGGRDAVGAQHPAGGGPRRRDLRRSGPLQL